MVDKKINLLKTLNKKLSASRKVIATIGTEGWGDIVQPIIDRMIMDVIGGRTGDFWDAGDVKTNKTLHPEYLFGYRQSLIDFHNRIWNYKAQEKNIEKQIKMLEDNKERVIAPMQDSPYADV